VYDDHRRHYHPGRAAAGVAPANALVLEKKKGETVLYIDGESRALMVL
jgi:hypothetical protein